MAETETIKDDEKELDAELEGKPSDKAQRVPDEAARKLCQLAVEQYELYQEAFAEEIQKAKDDIAFCVDGDHWTIDGRNIKKEREADGRLAFTKNRAPSFIDNVTGNVRQNPPRIKFRPVDSKTDPALADIYNAGIKYTESISRAHRQYIPAFEQACTAGYPGWARILTDYVDQDSFEQDIFIRFIPAQFGPALDPTAAILDEPGKGGPKWGIIPEEMSWSEYRERFPDAAITSWEGIKDSQPKWANEKTITIASYYRAIPTTDTLCEYETGEKLKKSSEEYKAFIKTNPEAKVKRERELITWEIRHYLINSVEILKGPEVWPGKYIPLIPFEGKWFMDNGRKKYRSVYREAKDANRQENLWASTISELILDEPYKATVAQIGVHKEMWEARNKKKYGVLYYEADPQLPGGSAPEKEDNSQKLAGAFNIIKQTVDDEKSLTNIFNASLGQTGNETSGRAINMRDAQSNTTNYAFIDNGAIAPLEYIAMMFVDLFPKIIDYEKTLKIMGEDDADEGEVTLNATEPGTGKNGVEPKTVHIMKDKQGNIKKLYANLKDVKFNITVDVGPGAKTQRMEALDSMVKMSQGNPVFGEASAGQVAKMLDMPDADKISARSEFILNTKYPGISQAGESQDGQQASIQTAVKQATDKLEQQSMQAFQAAEQKIKTLEQEKQESAVKVAQMQQTIEDVKRTYELKNKEDELKRREHDLVLRERELSTQRFQPEKKEPGEKSEKPENNELEGLRQQVADLAQIVDKITGGANVQAQ